MARTPEPVTDARIEREKAANRGLVAQKLLGVLAIAEREAELTGDPRYLKLQLEAVDRLAKLLRLYDAETQADDNAAERDRARMVEGVLSDLMALEAKVARG